MKIAITTSSFGKFDKSPLLRLEEAKIEYELSPYGRKLTEEETIEMCKSVDGVIAGTEPLDSTVLSRLSRLKIISRCGVGLDNVDLDFAAEKGIEVTITPYGPTLAVVELTVGLILDLMRKVTLMDRELRSGIWQKRMGNLLQGKKIGIVGYGRIGQKLAEYLQPFAVEINYSDVADVSCPLGCVCQEFDDLLSWADIITLHLSVGRNTQTIIAEKEIKLMRRGSWLVNVARGGLVDEKSLYNALKQGDLAGAAIDVFEDEPYIGELTSLDNVILTPHIGSYAREARINMENQAVENIIKGLASA